MHQLLNKQINGFLNTPPLWQNQQFNIQQFEFPKIILDDFITQPFPPKIRLGHQMEYVFKQLIEHCPEYELLLYNLPIRQDKLTLGEIDFVLKNVKTEALIHIELTYKFYIISTDISEPIHQLLGPNGRDAFFGKVKKIKNEQFQLLHHVEGAKALLDNQIDLSKIVHQTCFKAQLFEPYGSTAINISPFNSDCIVGYWLRFDDFNSEAFENSQFYIPCKSAWVIEPHIDVQWNSYLEILSEINPRMLKERAPMVWMKKTETAFEKFFVVWWE